MNPNKLRTLQQILASIPQANYPVTSRTHPLKSFNTSTCACYVKREDELGFGISGSKIRKYRTLIPYLLSQNIGEVIVIGGAFSNNVLGITQLLIENGITPTLFLRGEPIQKPKGNALFIQLLVDPSLIHWISRKEWPDVQQHISQYIQSHTSTSFFVLDEGASVKEALPGVLTLPLDILQNESDLNKQFNHLFLDVGTGLTAIALLLGYAWIEKTTHFHLLLLADTAENFVEQLKLFHHGFEELLNCSCPYPENYTLHIPQQAASFGSTTKGLFNEIRKIASQEGFFTDPIYSGKLFLESKRLIDEMELSGEALIIHTGGCLTLAGFQEQLSK